MAKTGSIFRKVLLQLFALCALLLVLLAVYVSLGRQLIPLISRYQAEIEQRLSAELGVPIEVQSVQGGWNGFNPAVTLEQVEATVADVTPAGTSLQRAVQIGAMTLELNVWQSLRRRELVLETVNIRGPEFDLVEQADGGWQLAGVTREGAFNLDAARVFNLASRFGNFELTQTRINLHFLSGDAQSLVNGRVHFQSRGTQHFLHLDASWGDGDPVSLSAELYGNRVDELSGQLHLLLPESDYSALFNGLSGQTQGHLSGEAEIWAEIAAGVLYSLQSNIALSVEWPLDGAPLQLENLSASVLVRQAGSAVARPWPDYDIHVRDLTFNAEQAQWRPANLSLLQADDGFALNLGAADAAMTSRLLQKLPDLPEGVRTALQTLDPRGTLNNLLLETSWQQERLLNATLKTNMTELNVSALNGAPAIWGANGYAEAHYEADTARLNGFTEIEAQELMLHLPRLFREPWLYDHVNGRVNLELDLSRGIDLRLWSGVIRAESEVIDGHAQFALDYRRVPDAAPVGSLELIAGSDRADAAYKHLYLPLAPEVAPNVRQAMAWVDAAVQGGLVSNSGLIYRGSIIKGATPAERSLQMVYEVEGGTLQFHPDWPALEALKGVVRINNREVDIAIQGGNSQGLALGPTRASVRPAQLTPGNWVLVNGTANGDAGQALNYLQQIPPLQALAQTLGEWEASGHVEAGVQLALPLSVPGASQQVQVQTVLGSGGALSIPTLDLTFRDVGGKMLFSLENGLRSEALTATLFGGPVNVEVSSSSPGAEDAATTVNLAGITAIGSLSAWDLNTSLSRALLEFATGEFRYTANYVYPHQPPGSPESPRAATFSLQSDLDTVALALPAPLQKDAGNALPVALDINFLPAGPRIRGSIRDIVTTDLNLRPGGTIRDGLLFLGPRDETLPIRRFNRNAPGLEVLGQVGRVDYAEWRNLVERVVSSGAVGTASLRNFAHLADVHIAELAIFGQTVQDLDLQLTGGEAPEIVLNSEMISGTIRLPADEDGYLDLRLAHLRLPAGADEEEAGALAAGVETIALEESVEPEEPAPDPLADIDPRSFPRLRFQAGEVSLGEADYGQWRLQVDPQNDGALFTDLQINARGLQVGSEDDGGTLFWGYDGQTHVSQLQAQVTAGNLGQVLSAFGYAPSLESERAVFNTDLGWTGSPASFSSLALRGGIDLQIFNGRFLQGGAAGSSALKLISILNFDALVRRLRFSDDLVRAGLAYDEINGSLLLNEGLVSITDRLQIIGPSSLFQIRGDINLREETIDGSMYITLPVSDNIPWLGGLAALNNLINWQVAVGVFIFDRLFSEQMDNLTSAQYLLQGPWDELEPRLNQVFTAGGGASAAPDIVPSTGSAPALPAGNEPLPEGTALPVQ